MPLIRKPTTQELEDHFFGSGAFSFGWFELMLHDNVDDPLAGNGAHFPVRVVEYDETDGMQYETAKTITEDMFVEGIKKYAKSLPDRSFDDLIEDMDSVDVDNVIQLIMFDEIRYA